MSPGDLLQNKPRMHEMRETHAAAEGAHRPSPCCMRLLPHKSCRRAPPSEQRRCRARSLSLSPSNKLQGEVTRMYTHARTSMHGQFYWWKGERSAWFLRFKVLFAGCFVALDTSVIPTWLQRANKIFANWCCLRLGSFRDFLETKEDFPNCGPGNQPGLPGRKRGSHDWRPDCWTATTESSRKSQ